MGAEIDRLEITIESKATKVNNSLDTLVTKLDKVSGALSHLNSSGLSTLADGVAKFSQASAQLSNVKTADFTRLANNIEKLSNLNSQQIYDASHAMRTLANSMNSFRNVTGNSAGVAEFVSNISKLGGVNVQRAITYLPALATAMNNLMTTLSRAPQVSDNIIRMTAALAGLAAQGSRVGTVSNSLTQNVNRVGTAMSANTKKAKGFASVIGSLYQKYFWIRRIGNKLWDSIENSMSYVETLNYFDAAFGQVADVAVSQWEEAGYSSADAYYESFSNQAKELTSKMTGFNINEDGTLTATGNASLGINPSKLMNYQAMFAQMSSSMGVASETSLKLSQALTEIGADLASVKNMDFDKVWTDMASGLAGMSRTLDKYGVNIRNVNLQQKLFDLGINENITNLNQNDKALLRAIILLDSTRYAWGDLADTLNQPANQMRLLTSNINNLSRTVGNLFLPMLSKVLPYVNGLVIALQRLATWLGNLMGIDLSEVTSGIGSSEVDIGGLLDETDGLGDSLDDASESAKKLKSNLQGFDELNVITTQQDTSDLGDVGGLQSGLLDAAFEDAFSEYQAAWDEAFANMENRAEEFADKIEGFFQPIKNIINDFAIGDYFQVGKDTSELVAGIFNFFANAIDDVDWYGIGENIGDYLRGIDWFKILGSVGKLIWQALKATLEFWSGMLSTAPIETAFVSLVTMPNLLKVITSSKLVTGITKLVKNFKLINAALAGNKESFTTLLAQYPKLGKAVEVARKAIVFANLRFGIENGNFFAALNSGINTIRSNLTGLQKGAITTIAGFAEFQIVSNTFEGLVDGSENLVAGIAKISGTVAVAGAAMYVALGPAGAAIAGVTALVAAVNGINDAFDAIRAEEIGNTIKNAMNNPGGTPLSEITSNFADALNEASEGFTIISDKSSEMDNVQRNIEDTWTEIYKIQEAMENGVLSVEEGKTQLETLFSELATLTEQKFSAMNTAILSAYGENGSFRSALEQIGIDTEAAIDTMITYGYQNSERAKEIAQQLAGVDINSEEYKLLTAELASLTGEMDAFAQASSDFAYDMNSLKGAIDYSEIFSEGGSLNTEALKGYLNEASMALNGYKTDLDAAGKEISQYWQEIYNSTTATEEQKTIAKANLDYIPQAVESMKTDAELQIVAFTDMLQNDFIARTNQIIDDEIATWNEKSPMEQWWNGVWGAGTESECVKEAVDRQQKNIDELSSAIEASFENLKTDGVVWVTEAAEEIYGALFDSEYHFSEIGGGRTVYTLKENYKEIINRATDGIAELAAERGQDAVDGYENAFANTESLKSTVKTFVDETMNEIAEAQDSHSPSKVTESLGKDAVDGYNLGFTNNIQSTLDTVSTYMTSVKLAFTEFPNILYNIGTQAMNGLLNGISTMESDIYDKSSDIADNIAKTIQAALDIHSPSRVMFALGEYTMEGFQLGMENLYGNIQKSVSEFGGTLQYDIAPTPQLSYAGIPNNMFPATEYNNYSYYDSQNNYDATETNGLLRELLSAVRAGQVIECNGREIGKTVRDVDTEYYNRTGKGMFQH